MRSISKVGLTLLIALFFAGCTYHHSVPHSNLQQASLIHSYAVAAFDTLAIQGDGDILLTSTQPGYFVSVQGASLPALSQFNLNQQGRTLHVQAPQGTFVTINTPNLLQLKYSGSGHLETYQLTSNHLDANLNNNGYVELVGPQITLVNLQKSGHGHVMLKNIKTSQALNLLNQSDSNIDLSGVININQLNYNGSGIIKIVWVNSPSLTIKAGNRARLFLAGIAKNLYVDLAGFAYLDAKYLRVNNAFVHTTSHARADVAVQDSLHAFATDSSNIYYYRLPRLISRYMRGWGSVLDMVGLDLSTPSDGQRF